MSGIKTIDIAKKIGKRDEDVKNALADAGHKIADDGSVSEDGIKMFGLDPKHLQLDKRQEMLKKAMERHKRHPKSREVKVNSPEGEAVRKISKQELIDRKKKLENTIRTVDENRETMSENSEEFVTEKVAVTEEIKQPAVKQETAAPTASAPVEEAKPAPAQPAETQRPAREYNNERPVHNNRDGQHGDRPQYNRDNQSGDRPQYNRDRGDRPQYNRDNQSGDRPQYNRGDRPQYNRDNQSGDRPQYNRDNQGGDRPQYNRDNRPPYNRDNQSGDRPQYNRDNRPPYNRDNQGGDRPQYNRDNRPPYNRDNQSGDRPQYNRDTRPPYNRDNQSGDRPQYNRDNRPPYNRDNQSGDRPPYNRDNRPPYNRDNQSGDRPPYNRDNRPPYNNRGGDNRPPFDKSSGDRPPYRPQGGPRPQAQEEKSIAELAEKKKVIREKPKTETVETKKAKAKTTTAKKEKNIHKGVDEGIELFELEKQILSSDGKPVEEVEAEVEVEEVKEKKQHDNRNKRPQKRHKGGRREEKPEPVIVRPAFVQIGENIIVSELAKLMGVKATELIKKLISLGVMANVNQSIDADTATLLSAEYGIDVRVKFLTEDDLIPKHEDKPEDLVPRPPIVTVMGHVDHGKTSLLDRIRQTAVAEGEAGGITQHIGAYEVKLDHGTITFLDTPGHEAFTTLRARGASVTDVVILVVAADDGVMPQTKEAIDHAKAAGVKIIVAINKIDKENANPQMVRNQLADHGLISEDWGGDTQFQEISAKQNLHVDDLLERVLLEAELLELKGNPEALAEGIVIESKLDKQKGPVATVLINRGTLNKGDNFVVGTEFGKVRAMFNYKGNAIKEAGLSVPVEIMGFSGVPSSGDRFIVTPDEKTARAIAELRSEEKRKANLAEKSAVSLADIFNKIKEGKLKELNIVLKADVQGSLEALKSSLIKLSNPEVKVNIISSGVGGISENDIILATASSAIIIGFNVRPGVQAKAKAEQEGIELNLYSVIYKAIEDVKQAMEGMLDPSRKEETLGRAEVRQVFSVPKIGKIAGSYVTEGKAARNANVRVVRDSIVIYDGKLSSLKRFQDDAKEVAQGYECGIGVDKYNDLKEGDFLEFYIMVEEKRTLEDVRRDSENREKEAKKED